MGTQLEDLQRKARLLENEIDVKLISLNKFDSVNSSSSGYSSPAQTGQGLRESSVHSKRTLFDSLTGEIESKLAKLSEINDTMQECLLREGGEQAQFSRTPQQHVMRRHRDILRDYSAEFNRTFANIRGQLQREELMDTGSGTGTTHSQFSTVNNRCRPTDYLVREGEAISDCDRLLNDQISIAMSVKEGLYAQTSGLGSINKRVLHLTKKYPAINNLMNKIRMKKRKDTLVLAAIISGCLIFLFLYIMH